MFFGMCKLCTRISLFHNFESLFSMVEVYLLTFQSTIKLKEFTEVRNSTILPLDH